MKARLASLRVSGQAARSVGGGGDGWGLSGKLNAQPLKWTSCRRGVARQVVTGNAGRESDAKLEKAKGAEAREAFGMAAKGDALLPKLSFHG